MARTYRDSRTERNKSEEGGGESLIKIETMCDGRRRGENVEMEEKFQGLSGAPSYRNKAFRTRAYLIIKSKSDEIMSNVFGRLFPLEHFSSCVSAAEKKRVRKKVIRQ